MGMATSFKLWMRGGKESGDAGQLGRYLDAVALLQAKSDVYRSRHREDLRRELFRLHPRNKQMKRSRGYGKHCADGRGRQRKI
jgi:hypothetical protein